MTGKRRSYLSSRGYVGYRTRIALVRENAERYEPVTISHPRAVYEFLEHIRHADRESLYSIMLDNCNHVIGCEEVARGCLNSTRATPGDIYKGVLLRSAAGLILSHNHPSGSLDPSVDDIEFTKNIAQAGEIIGIPLFDHVIVSYYGFRSLKEEGYL